MKWLKVFVQGKIDQYKDWKDPDREANQMSCPEITVPEIGNDLYEKLLAEANAAGAQFSGTEATLKNCTFDWAYDPEVLVLHVTCTAKPFYFSCGMIENEIRSLIQKAKEGI